MERRAKGTKRKKEINRNENKEQSRNGRKSPISHGKKRHSDTKTRTAISNQIHNGRAGKLHHKDFHCDFTEILAGFVHLPMLRFIRFEDFKLFQSLYAVQKGVSHRGVLIPIFCEYPLCPFGNGNDGYGNQGHTAKQNECYTPFNADGDAEQNKRSEHCVEELRDIRRIVEVKLFHTFHRYLCQTRHAHAVRRTNTQLYDLVIYTLTQILLCFSAEGVFQITHKAGCDISDSNTKCRTYGWR